MRVLVVASTFPASDADEAPDFVKQLVVALAKGFPHLEIDVLAPQWGGQTPSHVRHQHFDEYRFAYFWPRSWQRLAGRGILPALQERPARVVVLPFLFIFETVALLRLVRRRSPNVIYAHWFTPQGVVAAFVSRRTGIPFVLTSHAEDVRVWRRLPLFGPAVVRWLLPQAARLTAVSPATRDKMQAFFSAGAWRDLESRVAVLSMGVDATALDASDADVAALSTELGLGDKRVIAFLGRLVEKKGVAHLIEAFGELVRSPANRDLVLVLAGDGPLREELRTQVRRLGLENLVRFPGYVSGRRKAAVFQVADVVAVPSVDTASDSEGLPVVVLESLAAGTFCVATDATHADGVVTDGVSGYLVPQGDPAALAAALDRALSLSGRDRRVMVDAGRSAVADLDWPSAARRHYTFLLEPFEPRVTAS